VASFLEDLNPQLQTTINSEFAKVEGQAAPEPTRTCADLKELDASSSGSNAPAGTNPLDDILPRVDLDKLVASTTAISGAASANWKDRKEGLEGLFALLEVKSNSRLKANMGTCMIAAIK
jgi:cytoskeleton-associated protein 5